MWDTSYPLDRFTALMFIFHNFFPRRVHFYSIFVLRRYMCHDVCFPVPLWPHIFFIVFLSLYRYRRHIIVKLVFSFEPLASIISCSLVVDNGVIYRHDNASDRLMLLSETLAAPNSWPLKLIHRLPSLLLQTLPFGLINFSATRLLRTLHDTFVTSSAHLHESVQYFVLLFAYYFKSVTFTDIFYYLVVCSCPIASYTFVISKTILLQFLTRSLHAAVFHRLANL